MLNQKCISLSSLVAKKIVAKKTILLAIILLWCIGSQNKELYGQINPDSLFRCFNEQLQLDDIEIPKTFVTTEKVRNQYLNEARRNNKYNMESLFSSISSADYGSTASLLENDILHINQIVKHYRNSKLVINEINTNGTIGTTIVDENIDKGWSEIDVVSINGQNYMVMFSDYDHSVYIQELNSNGTPGSVVFMDTIKSRSENFNFFSAKTENSLTNGHDNKFILHDHVVRNFASVQTYIYRIDESNPFSGNKIGELLYFHWPEINSREQMKSHKNVIVYNHSSSTYLFFYGHKIAMFYELRFGENPFSELDLGSLVYYSDKWKNSWTNIKIFSHNNVPYILLYNASNGHTKIFALDLSNDFRNGLGSLVFDDHISRNWKVIEIFNQSTDPDLGASAFILLVKNNGVTKVLRVRNTESPFGDDLGETIYESNDRSVRCTSACTFTAGDKLFLIRVKK